MCRVQCPFWKKDDAGLLVGVSAFSSLHCFDTVGWVTGINIWLVKKLCPINLQRLSSETGDGRNQRGTGQLRFTGKMSLKDCSVLFF